MMNNAPAINDIETIVGIRETFCVGSLKFRFEPVHSDSGLGYLDRGIGEFHPVKPATGSSPLQVIGPSTNTNFQNILPVVSRELSYSMNERFDLIPFILNAFEPFASHGLSCPCKPCVGSAWLVFPVF